ncbi:Predicted arabinose efflux permease, MFS family [Arthrobacter sp. UNCCL28]|uniref:MFS transporter n=1 Tax=Micrococcaceae TaxID=1268 RepID=UPI000876E456|nr:MULTISPECIES: MFS transporter [Micrococcaceae]SCZ56644.1 Predicted arabinose efflux permease, MFS family [Arthrobacter sp. UNCCL28]
MDLWLQTALTQAAWQGVRVIMSYQALAVTGSAVFVGLQSGAFALAGLLIALPTGRLADRFGCAIVCSLGLLIATTGTVAALFFPVSIGLLIAALLLGAGHVGLVVGQQSFAAKLATGGNTDTAFGTLTAAASIGQLIGPPVVATVAAMATADIANPNTALGLMICLGFLILAMPSTIRLSGQERLLQSTRKQATRGNPPIPLQSVLRVPGMWQSLVVSGIVFVSVDLLSSFLPVWAQERGVPATIVGLLLATRAVVTISSRIGMPWLLDRLKRKFILIAAIGLAVFALSALPLVNQWWAFPLMCLIGIGLGLPQPLTMTWVVSLAPRSSRGAALGLRMTCNRLVQVSLPLAVSTIAVPIGIGAVFWSAAACLAFAAAISVGAHMPAVQDDADDPG